MSSTPDRSTSTVSRGARRLASFATNLLVSGVIVVVGLTAGREVLWWWRTPSDGASSLAATTSADDEPAWSFESGVFDLRFGDAPLLVRRHPLTGTRAQAADALRRHAVELAQRALARSPQGSGAASDDTARESADITGRATKLPAALSERLAKQLETTQPVVGEPGRWALHEWDDPWPFTVVVRPDSRETLAWGLAMPGPLGEQTQRTWSLFVWSLDEETNPSADGNSSLVARVEFPRPPGSRPGLTVQARDGSGLAQFEARGKNLAWCEAYYEDWARQTGAQRERPWRGERGVRSARYRADDGARWQIDLDGRSADAVQGLLTRWNSDQTTRE